MSGALHTHLNSYHKQHSRLTIFAGFEMPLWYRGISEEHLAVRNTAGLFDVTHMGRFEISGQDASPFLNYLLPFNVQKVADGRAFYTTMCNEKGGILDDTVIFRLDLQHYIMVGNATNRQKDLEWLRTHSEGFEVTINNASDSVAMLALQGPQAEAALQKSCAFALSRLKRFSHVFTSVAGVNCLISRTGYTGEDGFEIMVLDCPLQDPWKVEKVWNTILSDGEKVGVKPCGLGARDTLRLEAGYCLFGQDIDESTNPFEADLGSLISFDKGDFVGRESLLSVSERVGRKRRGIVMKGVGIPRSGCEVVRGGVSAGKVTSGTFSPVLKKGIAMAYVSIELAEPGTDVMVSIRDGFYEANVANFPLFDPSTYGWKRAKT